LATIHRHSVPVESYEPDRPLNDLGRDQLRHFIHVAQRLPAGFRFNSSPPSPEDGPACTRYIAAVTDRLMSMRTAGLTLVDSKKPRKTAKVQKPGLAIAAAAAEPESVTPTSARSKSSRGQSSKAKSSKAKSASARTAKPGGRKP